MSECQIGLEKLGRRIRRDLEMLQYPPADWVIPRQTNDGQPVLDVAVIGGGMCGLVATFALLRAGISNIRTFDSNDEGREGPWPKYARMETLRSPKTLAGPALGLPSLTFQAWYEAQWGRDAWAELGRIPTQTWMDYLIWYREVLSLKIENRTSVEQIEVADHGFNIRIKYGVIEEEIPVRKIILATGREGMAEPRIPSPLQDAFGPQCQHSSEDINFDDLHGKEVAVIGISASAIDNAATALEAGASMVHILARAPAVPRVNKMKSTVYSGFTNGFPRLSLAERMDLLSYVFKYRVAPPQNSVQRVWKHKNVKLHLDAELTEVKKEKQKLLLLTRHHRIKVDHVILGTGFKINVNAPRVLKPFSDEIKTFRDTKSLADNKTFGEFLDFPDLGSDFELQEKVLGKSPYLKNLHEFTFAATVSHGNVSGDIPAISDGADRLVKGITASIFQEDFPKHLSNLYSYEEPELHGNEIPENKRWWPEL